MIRLRRASVIVALLLLISAGTASAELKPRLPGRLTSRASAKPLRFGIAIALKCDPVQVFDADRPATLASMDQT